MTTTMCSICGTMSVPAESRGSGRDPGGRRRPGDKSVAAVVEAPGAFATLPGVAHAAVAVSTPAPNMPPRTSRRDQRGLSTMGGLLVRP